MRERNTQSILQIYFLFSVEGAGQEEEPVGHKLCPVTPNSSIEMGLTSLAMDMATQHLEEESSDVSSCSSILEKTAFLSEVCW